MVTEDDAGAARGGELKSTAQMCQQGSRKNGGSYDGVGDAAGRSGGDGDAGSNTVETETRSEHRGGGQRVRTSPNYQSVRKANATALDLQANTEKSNKPRRSTSPISTSPSPTRWSWAKARNSSSLPTWCQRGPECPAGIGGRQWRPSAGRHPAARVTAGRGCIACVD